MSKLIKCEAGHMQVCLEEICIVEDLSSATGSATGSVFVDIDDYKDLDKPDNPIDIIDKCIVENPNIKIIQFYN